METLEVEVVRFDVVGPGEEDAKGVMKMEVDDDDD